MKNTLRFFGIIALAALIGFSMAGCSSPTGNDDSGTPPPSADAIELTSPITADRTLGPDKNYVYKGNNYLQVNGGTLTVLQGTTITFTQVYGGLEINDGAMLTMNGTAAKPIILQGQGVGKGRWAGIYLYNNTADNSINYVKLLAPGSDTLDYAAGVLIHESKLSMTNCLIDNSKGYGLTIRNNGISNNAELVTFTGNTISNCAKYPVCADQSATSYQLRNITNDNPFYAWTGNGTNNMIYIPNGYDVRFDGSYTIHSLRSLNPGTSTYSTIPWYFPDGLRLSDFVTGSDVTIEAGADIILGSGSYIQVPVDCHLIAEGTVANHITFRPLPGSTAWGNIWIASQTRGSKLNYCDISGGGTNPTKLYQGLVYVEANSVANAYLEINNTTLTDSSNYGLFFKGNSSGPHVCYIANSTTLTYTRCISGTIGGALHVDYEWE